GYHLLADGDGYRILVMTVQNNRISLRYFHIENLHIIIAEGEMVMRLVVHGRDRGSLCGKRQRCETYRCKARGFDFHGFPQLQLTIYAASNGESTNRKRSEWLPALRTGSLFKTHRQNAKTILRRPFRSP